MESSWIEEIRIPEEQKVFDGRPFPLIVGPKSDLPEKSFEEWEQWIKDNTNFLKNLLFENMAVYFRGFPLETPELFDRFVKAFGYEAFPYLGGSAPRKVITGNVFTANEAPLSEPIPYHHEMSQQLIQPQILYFYCDVPAKQGGQTSITPSHVIYRDMKAKEPAFVERLEKEGVQYQRIMPEEDDTAAANGRGWKSTYFGRTREEAEANAIKQGNTVEWIKKEDEWQMKIVIKRPAIRVDSRRGRKLWFNHIITHWNGWTDARNIGRKSVLFPNGEEMGEGEMEVLEDVLETNTVDITWQKGDAMWVDNRQALHARRPGVAPRRVLACLCKDEPLL